MSQSTKWLIDCGDIGDFEVTESQKNIILKADQAKMRFISLGDQGAVINIAFIRAIIPIKPQTDLFLEAINRNSSSKPDELTDEQREASLKRLQEIKKNFRLKTVN